LSSLVSRPLLRAVPHLSLGRSLYGELGNYFKNEKLRISFTFQAKYLGMSPWTCPAAFTIIPYIEHTFGIDHVVGGLSRISDAMETVAREHGADFRLNTHVRRVLTTNHRATGVELDGGERIEGDAVVVNADFGHAMSTLFEPGVIRKWSPEKLRRRVYSCSTYMLYLGLDKVYNEPHHHVVFADDYRANVEEIVRGERVPRDMSVYIRNASGNDTELAPPGHSAVYVLVPTPNNLHGPVWTDEFRASYREQVLDRIASRTGMHDIRSHIVEERSITPTEWERERSLFLGATFNLGHTISQMLYFRPHNRFEEVKRCYLVGGGTHPGSGLPTIYESARITANLIGQDLGNR
jgi:phytoene desaturase